MELTSAGLRKEAKNFHLKKRLGQHFLVDPEALQCIASLVGATTSDTIVEVGPGIGFLTRLLAQSGARIVAVELDRESVESLEEMHLDNVQLRHGDFLRFDLNNLQFFQKHTASEETAVAETPCVASDDGKVKIAGNVPYQITGLILGHLLGEIDRQSPWLHRIESIVLTVQKEVAERMVAKAGSDAYSRVSLLVGFYCEASLELVVPRDSFYPPPAVTSAIVRLIPRKQPAVRPKNIHLFKQIIDAGFRQRRKMLKNDLGFLRLSPAEIEGIYRKLNFDPQVRAERLSLQQFAMLADAIDEYLNKDAQNKSAGTGEG